MSAARTGSIGDSPPKLSVGICTYRRPEVLRDLLHRLAVCVDQLGSTATVELVVVDDDINSSAQAVVDDAREAFSGRVRYYCAGSQNIAIARNHVLDLGLESSDYLAMIDDDCLPTVDWLRELVEVQRRTDADAVAGACDTELPQMAPRWLREQPFIDQPADRMDGGSVEQVYIKNILFSADFLRRSALRFDLRFGTSGGEDAMFISTAFASGMRLSFAPRAVVTEQLPVERTSLRYQMRRRLWYGNTEALTTVASGRSTRVRTALRGAAIVGAGAARPLMRFARNKSPHWLFGFAEILRGVGRLIGAAGIELPHR